MRIQPWPTAIQEALQMPHGARFYRCALQVNPYDYLVRHRKETAFESEDVYNRALIDACRSYGIEVIAVTDHYRVRSAVRLWEAARSADLQVFPGFEAVTKEGVHILCLFDPTRTPEALERIIGACGITDDAGESPTGSLDALEFLDKSEEWGGVCVAAHVASGGGLLRVLRGQPRANVWKSSALLACSLPGPISDSPDDLRQILENNDPSHRRDRPVAVVNAKDVNGPQDLGDPGASCWIKMSQVSAEGLRQAFLDPGSRIRLATDPSPEDHLEFVAMAWEGGFLDGVRMRFNENLNVLIGGRGTGKSSVIESIRYVLGLDPVGEEAKDAHEDIVKLVLRAGTKVSLLVRLHRPVFREYLIERSVPNPPVVRDVNGTILDLRPRDVLSGVEVYGQHEISEIARSPDKLTRLLDRFVVYPSDLEHRKSGLQRKLQESRRQILNLLEQLEDVDTRLSQLPALEERLKQFQEAGVEDRLKDQSLLVSEERVLETASARVAPLEGIVAQIGELLPIDRSFLSSEALAELPGQDILSGANEALEQLETAFQEVASRSRRAVDRARQALERIRTRWEEERRRPAQASLDRLLRELQATKLDGSEFLTLRRQVEELRPLAARQAGLAQDLKRLQDTRRRLVVEWEDVKTERFRLLDRAAHRVTRQLRRQVRVRVSHAADLEPLFDLLRSDIRGRLSGAIEALKDPRGLSLGALADAWRAGPDTLATDFGIPRAQAERLAKAPAEVVMKVEELDLPPITEIQLNVARDDATPLWRQLKDLSTGQKATAVLLLLLLESDAPLVVDQPEDDLDNRFIMEDVVPKMRDEKRRRQFVFSTHNANIPVLGDAELIMGLRASGEPGEGRTEIPTEEVGSIDSLAVRELVQEILEGGREAFETRRLKYGF